MTSKLILDDNMTTMKTGSNYHFSAVKVEDLGATEYTLATITLDVSGSVGGFKKDLEASLKTILKACQKSPRAENLMLRLVTFNDNLQEIHGFKLLNSIKESDYDGILDPDGMTALYDAAHTSIEATKDYAKVLADQDFLANAVIFVITDGMDNRSSNTPSDIKKVIQKTMKEEVLESVTVVLIGINSGDCQVDQYLNELKNKADITQVIDAGTATAGNLAKLVNFVSKSISSTSQALGSGAPSKLLNI